MRRANIKNDKDFGKGPVIQTTNQPLQRVFFPNLNGLRFLAVLLVIIDHVEVFRFDFGLSSFGHNPIIPMIGQLGVTLFFVLSGFLITYLLLAEKETLGQIKFSSFYLRRVLRIWPLYYVVVILGLFVLPHFNFFYFPNLTPLVSEHLAIKSFLYIFILPNIAKELYPAVPYLSQAWSIGVEEQFYIIWPILIHYSTRYLRNFLLLAAGIYIIGQLSWALTTPQRHILPINELTDIIKNFLFFFRIQCMAIGGLFALVLFRNWIKIIKILTNRVVQVLVWIVVIVMIVKGQTIPYITHEIYGALFGILILNLALTKSSIINLQYKALDYLGRISYGLYMLHGIAIVVSIRLANIAKDSLSHHVMTYVMTLGLSILLAAFSFRYVETPFLQLKKYFSRIKSGS